MSENLSEIQLYPQEIVDMVSAAVWEAREHYAAGQAEASEDLRLDINADDWLLIHYAACDALSLTDGELWAHASHYDEGDIPADGLAEEERRYWGSLLDRNVEWFMIYNNLQKTRSNAEPLAAQELRRELATRTVRLAYLSQLPPEEYAQRRHNFKLPEIARLTSGITDAVWQRMTAPSYSA